MNKESSENIRQQSRSKVKSLNDSSLKHYFKSISPKNKVVNSTSHKNRHSDTEKHKDQATKDRDKDNERNKENDIGRMNTSRGKPPINKVSNNKYSSSLKIISKNCNLKKKFPCLKNRISNSNNRNKADTNANKPLTAEITLSSSSSWITDHNDNSISKNKAQKLSRSLNNSSNTITKSASYVLKLQDEANQVKAINSKLKNDIIQLNQKIELLRQEIKRKTEQDEEKQLNNSKIISDLQNELSQLKSRFTSPVTPIAIETERGTPIFKSSVSITHYENIIKSLLSILIEIGELFISKNTVIRNSSTIQIENSVDVFESFNNNEDEKRSSLLDQIQNILISKLGYIKRTLNLQFNKEIERIQNWSSSNLMNQSINLNMISPLKHKVMKTNDDILNSLSKMYMNSNSTLNDFDLSVSGNFYAQSPKFNSFNEGVSCHMSNSNKNSNSNLSNCFNSNQKIIQKSPFSQKENVQIMSNDSLLDEIKTEREINNRGMIFNDNEDSLKSHLNQVDDYNSNNKIKINVLDCSIGDLVSPLSMIKAYTGVALNKDKDKDTEKEHKENMNNFTLDDVDVQNYDIIAGHT